jgi:Putative DNA-binding domain
MRPERAPRPSLASVQAALLSRITGQELGASAFEAASLMRGDARASADDRLGVYAFMYGSRLVEALESQFPRLARLLGVDAFAALTADYAADHPSRHPSLRELGRTLPVWLAAKHPARSARARLASLAALEWARADVYDLADEPALTLDTLRAFPAERFGELPLALIAAHRLVEVDRGTEALWDGLAPNAGDPPGALLTSLEASPGATLLVWRQEIAVYHRAVDRDERAALALVSAGSRFGVICDALSEAYGDEAAAARAFAWLSTWTADGLLAASYSAVSAESRPAGPRRSGSRR